MAESNSLSQRWQQYRPSKAAWLWSCVASIILTMIIGFTFGGWVTGGAADSMAAAARQDAREHLVASICVDRFAAASDANQNLQELKEASSWERDGIIEEGGWDNIEALEEQVSGAADLCAERLVAMEQLPSRAVDSNAATADSAPADG